MKLGRPSKKLALSVFAGVVTLVLVGVGLFQAVGASDGPTPREKNWSAPRDIAVKSDEMQVELEESIPERQLLDLKMTASMLLTSSCCALTERWTNVLLPRC